MFRIIAIYFRLTKSLLSLAIAMSACIGYFITGNDSASYIFVIFISVYLLSSGAAALNQYIERRTDSLMSRTAGRPIPAGQISPRHSLIISIIFIIAGATLLYQLSFIAMLLGILNVIIYNFIYTPLKYRTHLALLPGGVVGAIPPLIGWFASGISFLAPSIICFSLFMFFWQIPHFIILNIKYVSEYKAAGIVTLSGAFSSLNVKLIMLVWLFSAVVTSMLFPLAGIISSIPQLLILIILNIVVIVLFAFSFLGKRQLLLNKANIFIHLYLIFLFLIIISSGF